VTIDWLTLADDDPAWADHPLIKRHNALREEAAQALADLNALQLPVEWPVLDAAVRRAFRANREATALYEQVCGLGAGRPIGPAH